MATKAELEKQLETVRNLDEETAALAGVVEALEPLNPRWGAKALVRERVSRVLRYAGERFGVELYALGEADE